MTISFQVKQTMLQGIRYTPSMKNLSDKEWLKKIFGIWDNKKFQKLFNYWADNLNIECCVVMKIIADIMGINDFNVVDYLYEGQKEEDILIKATEIKKLLDL